MDKNLVEFPISVYGQITKVSDVFSRARVRIFYRGGNRNGTYITDEFANELISTLHYVPIKGIYADDDYTDHGAVRSLGRIYGIVPVDNNFAWEKHLDTDGVEREYACCDVLLFTALYPEANVIVGKGQSMELYEPTLKYHKAVIEGQMYVVFEHGSFLGLQVLGDSVEPCFEGASFFTLQKSIENTIQKIKEYNLVRGGASEMPNINFKLSDDQKYRAIWSLLNPDYTEEGNYTCAYSVCEVYDDYALAFNYEENCYERIYYTKDDSNDSVVISAKKKCYVVDVTESEKNTLDTLRQLNGNTYELVNENLTNAEKNAKDCAEFSTKIEELNSTISTLNTEAENINAKLANTETQYSDAQTQITALSNENEALKAYKKSVEDQNKETIVAQYTGKLSDEVLDTFRAKFDEYTSDDLDMHLAYELKKSNSSLFSMQEQKPAYLPKDTGLSGVEEILARYKK